MPFDLDGHENGFPIEKQRMTNWCWAACTLSVCNFYKSNPGLSQQSLVATMLNLPVCATPKLFPACNKTFDLAVSLNRVGHLAGNVVNGPLKPDEVFGNLSQGHPIGCQMDIPGIGGHAVIIVSAKKDNTGSLFLHVADPSDATILTMPFVQLRNNYRGIGGRWIRSYFTQPINI